MLSWIKRLFQKNRSGNLPQRIVAWKALEAARLFLPEFDAAWPNAPARYSRNLKHATIALENFVTGNESRDKVFRLASMGTMMAGGASVQTGNDTAHEIASAIRCAVETAMGDRDDFETAFLNVLSYADEHSERRPDWQFWTKFETLNKLIKDLVEEKEWAQDSIVPQDTVRLIRRAGRA